MFRAFFLMAFLFSSAAFSQTRVNGHFNNTVFSNGPDGSLGKAYADAKAARDKREAMKDAGELVAKGDYTGARNLLLRRGYLTEATHIAALQKADVEDQKAPAIKQASITKPPSVIKQPAATKEVSVIKQPVATKSATGIMETTAIKETTATKETTKETTATKEVTIVKGATPTKQASVIKEATVVEEASPAKPTADQSQKKPETLDITQPRTDDAIFVLKLPGLDY